MNLGLNGVHFTRYQAQDENVIEYCGLVCKQSCH